MRLEIVFHVYSKVQISIELLGLRVQVTIVAGKRNRVLGPTARAKSANSALYFSRIVDVGSAPVDDLETQPGVCRAVATQCEIDFRVTS